MSVATDWTPSTSNPDHRVLALRRGTHSKDTQGTSGKAQLGSERVGAETEDDQRQDELDDAQGNKTFGINRYVLTPCGTISRVFTVGHRD